MAADTLPDPMQPQLYRVRNAQRELRDTMTLELAPLAGPRPGFAAGQFNMLYAFGVGEIAISISGESDDDGAFAHTIRSVGAVSRALASCLPGTTVGLRGPYGAGWPMAEAEERDVVIIAGGLGAAPLRPAIRTILANRGRFGRVVVLLGFRHPQEVLYAEELARWRGRGDVEVEVTVDHAESGWQGHVGVVPSMIRRARIDPHRAIALVCGPEAMMRYTVNALREIGVADDRVHLSLERNMKCAIGWCGHCQFGPAFVCKDGPVMRFDTIARIFAVPEV